MDCKTCVFYSKKYPNRCALLSDKKVSFDCYCTLDEYKHRLKEMFKYADYKEQRCDSLEKGVWSGYKSQVVKELSSL